MLLLFHWRFSKSSVRCRNVLSKSNCCRSNRCFSWRLPFPIPAPLPPALAPTAARKRPPAASTGTPPHPAPATPPSVHAPAWRSSPPLAICASAICRRAWSTWALHSSVTASNFCCCSCIKVVRSASAAVRCSSNSLPQLRHAIGPRVLPHLNLALDLRLLQIAQRIFLNDRAIQRIRQIGELRDPLAFLLFQLLLKCGRRRRRFFACRLQLTSFAANACSALALAVVNA
jgi:hypothetical protein